MVYKTYISKSNTIVKGSPLNTSLNPVSDLVYGKDGVFSRALIYFDHSHVQSMWKCGIMPDMSKMRHILHITNAGSLDFTELHNCEFSDISNGKRVRACSFDLIFFLIPKEWDEGKGFDYKKTFINKDYYSRYTVDKKRLLSEDGCNWFKRRNGLPWAEEGVYSTETLSLEYDKFSEGDRDAKVIGRLRFQVGNEDLILDITDTFNRFMTGDLENCGIGIAYTPLYELSHTEYENYLGLFTDKTNLWFEPYVETRYEDKISDDRPNFVLNKDNKLYLYCTIGEHLDDLDSNPLVTIKDTNDEVVKDKDGNLLENIESKKFSKGIYYIETNLSSKDYSQGDMMYDTWSEIVYQGTKIDNVELDFVLKPTSSYFMIGNSIKGEMNFTPVISGIKQKEQIRRGDIRKIEIDARPNYTYNKVQLIDSMDIRLYVKDGEAEIDCISWDGVNKALTENFYVLDTNILVPNRYFLDVRISYGMSSIVHHEVLTFDIVDDKTNKFA